MTVTALLVSHDGARWLPAVLSGLTGQTHPVDRVVEEVGVRSLRDSEASLLGSAPGIPVLVVERTHYSANRPVETSDLIGSAEQCRLLYKLTLARPRRPGDPRRR